MDVESPDTRGSTSYFASSGRETEEEVRRQARAVANAPLLQAVIDAMSQLVLIVNERRQVVAVNRQVRAMFPDNGAPWIGKRPGELFGCVHPPEGPDGCGTARFCATCGAVEAILQGSKQQEQVTRECRLSVQAPGGIQAIDLRVTATPVAVNADRLTVCAVEDISDRKRLAVLQRMFFHDVLNTAGGIKGYAEMLSNELSSHPRWGEDVRQMMVLAAHLIDEIRAQRDLVYAESGDLPVRPAQLEIRRFLENLCSMFRSHPLASDRQLLLGQVAGGEIVTDGLLLARVLGNMIKNALEAVAPGKAVTVACADRGAEVEFSVHNPSLMPPDVQLQVFQRSFSTKQEAGRGIGTHSMKLLGERYLRGKVSFTSREPEGTTFVIRLPKVFPGAGDAAGP